MLVCKHIHSKRNAEKRNRIIAELSAEITYPAVAHDQTSREATSATDQP